MTIYPIQGASADRRHWVVKWLRYTGYMEVIAAVIVGIFYSYSMLTPMIAMMTGFDAGISLAISLLFGGLISFVAGLAISLPAWALSMVIDDIHALRIYHQGFVVTDRQGDKKDPATSMEG